MAKGERSLGHADTIELAEKLNWLLKLLDQLEIPTGEPMGPRVIGGPKKPSGKTRGSENRGKMQASQEIEGETEMSDQMKVSPKSSLPQQIAVESAPRILGTQNEKSATIEKGTRKKAIKDAWFALLLAVIFAAIFGAIYEYYGRQISSEVISWWQTAEMSYTFLVKVVSLIAELWPL